MDDKLDIQIEPPAEETMEVDVHNPATIEFDDDTGEVKVTKKKVVVEQEPTQEPEVVVETPVEEPVVVEVVDTPKTKKERAQQRIKELLEANKQMSHKYEDLRIRSNETQLAFSKRMVDSLKTEMERLKAERVNAYSENDVEKLASLDDAMDNVRSELREYSKLVNGLEESKSKSEENRTQGGLPEAAKRWSEGKEYLVDNSEYAKLPREIRAKISSVRSALRPIAEELIKEGFDTNDDIFYEEVDFRLSDKFPFYEGLASQGISVLSSDKDTSSGETEKPQPSKKTPEEKAKALPVKAPSPSNSSTKESARGGTSVTITREEYGIWERMLKHNGITLEDYAREKLKRKQMKEGV